jgi:hypothetical protein
MKAIASLVLVVGALALGAGTASAQSASAPWITAGRAANVLYLNDIQWDEGYDTVTYASCRGYGTHYGTRYRHFTCYVQVEEDDPYWVHADSVDGGGLDVNFLYYD